MNAVQTLQQDTCDVSFLSCSNMLFCCFAVSVLWSSDIALFLCMLFCCKPFFHVHFVMP